MKEVRPQKKPIVYYYLFILLAIILLNALIVPNIKEQEVKEVDYGTFLTMVEKGEVAEVKSKYIYWVYPKR